MRTEKRNASEVLRLEAGWLQPISAAPSYFETDEEARAEGAKWYGAIDSTGTVFQIRNPAVARHFCQYRKRGHPWVVMEAPKKLSETEAVTFGPSRQQQSMWGVG